MITCGSDLDRPTRLRLVQSTTRSSFKIRSAKDAAWSKDHESPRHLGFAMLDIGGRHALKERQLDGSGGNLANFEE
jgi:hypothetical protein